MKQERAQELYSDYLEGTLSPAMRLALEQHFQADPAARADYDEFAAMYTLFDSRPETDVDVPRGFRAKVLELAATEQAQRQQERSRGVFGWLRGVDRRTATTRIGLTFAAAASLLVIFLHPTGTGGVAPGGEIPIIGYSPSVSTVIQSVTTEQRTDGNTYHDFHVHLPSTVAEAAVTASVITSLDQITDPTARTQGAVSALANPQVLTNDESLQIPIALGAVPPAGMTLNLLVQWQPTNGGTAGAQVIFTPVGASDPASLTAPTDGTLYSALQAVASGYGVTVVADASSPQTQKVTMPASSSNADEALQTIAAQAGYSLQTLPNGDYQLYKP